MAEDNQSQGTPRIGLVGQPQPQGQPQQPQQQPGPQQGAPPQRGIPGAVAPPRPSDAEVARIVAEQQRATQAQAQVSQQRAVEMAKNSNNGQPVQVMTLEPPPPQPVPQAAPQPAPQAPFAPQAGIPAAQQTIPAAVAAGMPASMYPPVAPVPAHPVPPSPIQGVTAQQVLAGQPSPQPTGQFAQYAQQQEIEKVSVPWYPIRRGGVNVELTDSIIQFVPDGGIEMEGNAQAKVVLALFSEILSLREQVAYLVQAGSAPAVPDDFAQRVYNLERTLYEQNQGMGARARGVREQVELFQAQGMNAEQVVAALQGQSVDAAAAVVAPAPAADPAAEPPTE